MAKNARRQLNRRAKSKRLSAVLAPFILAFGGQAKTNERYFTIYPVKGKFEPDNRAFWSDVARQKRLPRAPAISNRGAFLRVDFSWMSSVALLSVSHLEAVVAVTSMLTNGRPNNIARRIIEHVIPAVEPHGADDVLVHPFDLSLIHI